MLSLSSSIFTCSWEQTSLSLKKVGSHWFLPTTEIWISSMRPQPLLNTTPHFPGCTNAMSTTPSQQLFTLDPMWLSATLQNVQTYALCKVTLEWSGWDLPEGGGDTPSTRFTIRHWWRAGKEALASMICGLGQENCPDRTSLRNDLEQSKSNNFATKENVRNKLLASLKNKDHW